MFPYSTDFVAPRTEQFGEPCPLIQIGEFEGTYQLVQFRTPGGFSVRPIMLPTHCQALTLHFIEFVHVTLYLAALAWPATPPTPYQSSL